MKKCILITHQFILPDSSMQRQYLPASKHGESWKHKVFDFCVKHYKKHNPDTYIIITGHGSKPLDSTLELADWYYWPEEIVEGEINVGHPKLITKGLEHAKEMGIEYVCKTRIDTVNLIPNITDYCHKALEDSGKVLLNTHYYDWNYQLMDLFMYSKVDVQLKLFNPNKWSVSWVKDGTGPVAKNLIEDVNGDELQIPYDKNFWIESLNKSVLFMSPRDLKWLDFRDNHSQLTWKLSENIMNNDLENFETFLWRH